MLAFGVLAASGAIAACGSSSSGSTTTKVASASTTPAATGSGSGSSSGFNSSTFRACLQKHGVTLPSRPAGAGTGTTPSAPPSGGSSGGGGGFAANPNLRAAIQACGGGNFRPGTGSGAGLSHTAIDNFVACVRKNGYPQMPNPNFSGTGSIFPTSVESNAKFKAASRACASMLRPSNAPSSGASTAAAA